MHIFLMFLSVHQVLYPAMLVILVTRALFMRVLPESLIEFRYFPKEDGVSSTWLSRVQKSWTEERSVLAWANQGRWHTIETTDEGKMREGNWFRIGFEPLFVDFTKSGTWFMIFSLVKVSVRNLSSKYSCAFSSCFRHDGTTYLARHLSRKRLDTPWTTYVSGACNFPTNAV